MDHHGFDLASSDLATELSKPLTVDRSLLGFGDFASDGKRAIEPGSPSRSLLYHAIASPNVLQSVDGTPRIHISNTGRYRCGRELYLRRVSANFSASASQVSRADTKRSRLLVRVPSSFANDASEARRFGVLSHRNRSRGNATTTVRPRVSRLLSRNSGRAIWHRRVAVPVCGLPCRSARRKCRRVPTDAGDEW